MRLNTIPLAALMALFLSLCHAKAWAQDGDANFNTDELSVVSADFEESFAAIDNSFLADLIKLNYQISLLEKLVERQAGLLQIKETFAGMGMDFKEPPPARGLCEQLPVNAPCLRAYPELHPDLVAARKAYYEELKARAAASNPVAAVQEGESEEERNARLAREEAAEREANAKIERRQRYQWTDVSCVAGQCKGVLVSKARPGYRITVLEGQRLSDGTRISQISADGITVNIAGDTIRVRPAPQEGGEQAEADGAVAGEANSAADGFANAFSSSFTPDGTGFAPPSAVAPPSNTTPQSSTQAANSPAPSSASPTANMGDTAEGSGASGQTIAEPVLGPSGLF